MRMAPLGVEGTARRGRHCPVQAAPLGVGGATGWSGGEQRAGQAPGDLGAPVGVQEGALEAQARGSGERLGPAGPYTDGSYQDAQTYKGVDELPSDDSIDVSVTLSGGAITDVTVTGHAASDTSEDYIQRFSSKIKGAVVGKSIEQAHVTALAGASKTSAAFNSAIDSIAEQARG